MKYNETELYNELCSDEYKKNTYKTDDLDEGMAVIYESMWGWWKPRYLVNHNTKCAYMFIDDDQNLMTITKDDIVWDTLKDLPEKAKDCARRLSFHYPSFIRDFKNGVAAVCWQLNPDGRYYMDDDGFGMTDDEEINIYGFINQSAEVVVRFRNVKSTKEIDEMRKEAETIQQNY